jgi:hypothetical protein
MNDKPGEAAIIVIAGPKGKSDRMNPPLPRPKKDAGLPELPGMEEDECEYCEGEGCERCEETQEEESYGDSEAEGTHKSHMKIIEKLAKMLEQDR